MELILRRIGGALITLLLASMVIFALVRFAPGDPIDLALGQGPGDLGVSTEMLKERKEELREQHGLNHSIPVQYLNWLKKVGTFDLGESIQSRRPVTQELGARIPATLLLSAAALLIESILGLLLGIYSAIRAGRAQDGVIRFGCVVLASLPAFVLSLILLFLFAVQLHRYEISSSAGLHRLWLPAITLGLVEAPRVVRLVRANILSELGQLYVSSALSRGLSKGMVVRGAFRNALLPIITAIALSFAHLVGGSIVIESIFNWPGLGNYAMNSILVHNYPAVQGYTVLTVATVIFINLLVEVAYIMADPRVRKRHGHGKITPKYGEGEEEGEEAYER